jgi:hypothetical protein
MYSVLIPNNFVGSSLIDQLENMNPDVTPSGMLLDIIVSPKNVLTFDYRAYSVCKSNTD